VISHHLGSTQGAFQGPPCLNQKDPFFLPSNPHPSPHYSLPYSLLAQQDPEHHYLSQGTQPLFFPQFQEQLMSQAAISLKREGGRMFILTRKTCFSPKYYYYFTMQSPCRYFFFFARSY
jgi:hypothetical protein